MAIQRNARIAPFSVNSPMLEKQAPRRKGEEAPQVIATTHQKWFTQVSTEINRSPEIVAIPASSSSAGQPGMISFDANWLYVCVGAGIWRRAALNSF